MPEYVWQDTASSVVQRIAGTRLELSERLRLSTLAFSGFSPEGVSVPKALKRLCVQSYQPFCERAKIGNGDGYGKRS